MEHVTLSSIYDDSVQGVSRFASQIKDEVIHALDGEVIVGHDDAGEPVYIGSDDGECRLAVLKAVDALFRKASELAAVSRAARGAMDRGCTLGEGDLLAALIEDSLEQKPYFSEDDRLFMEQELAWMQAGMPMHGRYVEESATSCRTCPNVRNGCRIDGVFHESGWHCEKNDISSTEPLRENVFAYCKHEGLWRSIGISEFAEGVGAL